MATDAAATSAASQMAGAARAFLDSLDISGRSLAHGPFDAPDRREFTYLPRPRPGLPLSDMTAMQRDRAMDLLATGLSTRGLEDAQAIMLLEDVLGGIERSAGASGWERRHAEYYWFRVLGGPGADAWAWKVGGHHLAVNLAIVDGRVAGTPQFFGANPARIPDGHPDAGRRTLPEEEDLGRALATALTPAQRERAVTGPLAPRDIITRHDPVADVAQIPPGLMCEDMDDVARDLLIRLVRRYLGRATREVAEPAWADIEAAGLDRVSFRWAGPTEPGHGHYYAVLGPTFLLEYDNTQHDANHIHSVWRDLRNDWGDDLLAAHYAAHSH